MLAAGEVAHLSNDASSEPPTETARSDFDGFFLFERVPYGRYSLRVAKDSAAAAGLMQALDATAEVSAKKPVARLGTVQARAPPRIALLE